jgi:hypothetical protein
MAGMVKPGVGEPARPIKKPDLSGRISSLFFFSSPASNSIYSSVFYFLPFFSFLLTPLEPGARTHYTK